MREWVLKSNPDKYKVLNGMRELISGKLHDWSVSKNTESGDRIFIGMSGPSAAVLAIVYALGAPYRDTSEDDPNWTDKDEARKPRWFAEIKLGRVHLPHGVPEARLRASGLGRIADFLHRQGTSLRLKPGEGIKLATLL